MVIKQEVAIGIAQGLSQFWKCEEFRDFTVKVDTVEFGCHQLILAACSDFFKGLFRSRMQEMEEKCATIYDISSEIFELLLESIYTGHDVLTNDNVIEIWRAAHQLQIHFMVTECEHFAIKTLSLDNYILYLKTCKALNSTIAIDNVWDFAHKNCIHFFETSYFLEIPIDEMEKLVKSQNLGTKSEDEVIQAILKWSAHCFLNDSNNDIQKCTHEESEAIFEKKDKNQEGDDGMGVEGFTKTSKMCDPNDKNDMTSMDNKLNISINTDEKDEKHYCKDKNTKELRCKYLTILLSNTRIYIVSQQCLKLLSKHDLVKINTEAQQIIMDALFYQLQSGIRNGHWPLKAIHRNGSNLKHCLINSMNIGNDGIINFYILATKKWFKLPSLIDFKDIKIAATDTKLYAVCIKPTLETYRSRMLMLPFDKTYKMHLSIKLLRKDTWSNVDISLSLCSQTFSVAMVDSFMFIFSTEESKTWKLDTDTNKLTQMKSLPNMFTIDHVMSYEQCIIVFHDTSVVETMVECYDTSNDTWTQLSTLEKSGNGMTSFIDEHSTYFLQPDGGLWKVVKTPLQEIDFKFVIQLWHCVWSLYGAVTFMDELIIHGEKSDVLNSDPTLKRSLPGVFSKINYLTDARNQKGMSIPFLMERNNVDQ